jgi:hypothetical protein
VVGVEGGVRRLVNKGFFEDAVALVQGGLADVDEDVVVAAAEQLFALVDPDGFDVFAKGGRETADDGGVFFGFGLSGFDAAELAVDLDFDGEPVVVLGVEEVRDVPRESSMRRSNIRRRLRPAYVRPVKAVGSAAVRMSGSMKIVPWKGGAVGVAFERKRKRAIRNRPTIKQ